MSEDAFQYKSIYTDKLINAAHISISEPNLILKINGKGLESGHD